MKYDRYQFLLFEVIGGVIFSRLQASEQSSAVYKIYKIESE
jgi:hypothetical protein